MIWKMPVIVLIKFANEVKQKISTATRSEEG